MPALRVFHGDDSPAFRRLIAELLPSADIEVVGGAGTEDEIVDGVGRERPDVLLLDQVADAGIVDRAREAAPGLRVVVLSGFSPGRGDPGFTERADGYVVKAADVDEIRGAVRGG